LRGLKKGGLKSLAAFLKLLSVEQRLRILALLAERPRYAYEISKELSLSYPLVLLHLKALEKAGLIESEYKVTESMRVRRYYKIKQFKLVLSPEEILRIYRGERDVD